MSHSHKNYLSVGRYSVAEAKKIFKKLKSEGVRFCYERKYCGNDVPSSGHTAKAKFGMAIQIELYIHPSDIEVFRHIYGIRIETPAPEGRSFLQWIRDTF